MKTILFPTKFIQIMLLLGLALTGIPDFDLNLVPRAQAQDYNFDYNTAASDTGAKEVGNRFMKFINVAGIVSVCYGILALLFNGFMILNGQKELRDMVPTIVGLSILIIAPCVFWVVTKNIGGAN